MSDDDADRPGELARSWDGRALPRISARLDLMIGSAWPELGKPRERFDPDEVTRRVGLAPTSSWRLGDPLGKKPIPGVKAKKRSDYWGLRAGPRAADNLGDVLDELRALLDPCWEQLVQACSEPDMLSCVVCVVELNSTFTGATAFAAPTVRWISELGAELDVDILTFHLTSDNEGDPDAEFKPLY